MNGMGAFQDALGDYYDAGMIGDPPRREDFPPLVQQFGPPPINYQPHGHMSPHPADLAWGEKFIEELELADDYDRNDHPVTTPAEQITQASCGTTPRGAWVCLPQHCNRDKTMCPERLVFQLNN